MLHASSWLLNEAKSFLKFKYNFTSLKTNPNTHSNVFFTNFFVSSFMFKFLFLLKLNFIQYIMSLNSVRGTVTVTINHRETGLRRLLPRWAHRRAAAALS